MRPVDTNYIGWAKKARPQSLGHNFVNLNRFTKFIAVRFLGKFAVNRLLKIQSLLTYYIATLFCEITNVRKQTISDKLQGSVATYLRFGRVVNIRIKEGLLLRLSVKKNEIGEYLAKSYKQERGCLMHFARWPTHC